MTQESVDTEIGTIDLSKSRTEPHARFRGLVGQQNLQGETLTGGVRAVRGQLTSVTSPRAALWALTEPTPSLWR